MSEPVNYDAVVIGAGLGGLGAASQLALAGQRVLVLERHSAQGGYATSFVRGRFEFEGALHELSGLGTEENPGGVRRFLTKLGIIPDLMRFRMVPEVYSCKFYDGYKLDLPYGAQEYADTLAREFPEEAANVRRFMKVCQKINDGFYRKNPLLVPWVARVGGLTVHEFLSKFFTNRRLMNIIAQFWCYFGPPPGECNAAIFVGGLMSYLIKGAWFPEGRSHNLSLQIARKIEELGGVMKYNAPVAKILLENGRTSGVIMANGDEYRANAVFANVNPVAVVSKMLPADAAPPFFSRRIYANAREIGPSIFTVYLGLNAPPEELGLDTYEVFLNTTDDLQSAAYGTGLDEINFMASTCYNLVWPEVSPPGTSMVSLTALMSGQEWHGVAPEEYFRVKDRVTKNIIDVFADYLCPKVYEHIEVLEAASPVTLYRYTRNPDGAVYGQHGSVYHSPLTRLSVSTPINGLYFCGAWTNEGGGFSPCIASGRKAASRYLKSRNLPDPGGA